MKEDMKYIADKASSMREHNEAL